MLAVRSVVITTILPSQGQYVCFCSANRFSVSTILCVGNLQNERFIVWHGMVRNLQDGHVVVYCLFVTSSRQYPWECICRLVFDTSSMHLSSLCSKIFNRQRTCLPVTFIIFRIQCSALQFLQTVNKDPSRYGLNRRTSHKTAKHSQWLVSYACSALFRDQDQYPTGLAGPSGFSWSRTLPIYLSHASMSNWYRLSVSIRQTAVVTTT